MKSHHFHPVDYKSQRSLPGLIRSYDEAAGAGGSWSHDVVSRGWGAAASELNHSPHHSLHWKVKLEESLLFTLCFYAFCAGCSSLTQRQEEEEEEEEMGRRWEAGMRGMGGHQGCLFVAVFKQQGSTDVCSVEIYQLLTCCAWGCAWGVCVYGRMPYCWRYAKIWQRKGMWVCYKQFLFKHKSYLLFLWQEAKYGWMISVLKLCLCLQKQSFSNASVIYFLWFTRFKDQVETNFLLVITYHTGSDIPFSL